MANSPYGEELVNISMADIERMEAEIWTKLLDAASDRLHAQTPEAYAKASAELREALEARGIAYLEEQREIEDEENEKRREGNAFWDSLLDEAHAEQTATMKERISHRIEAQLDRREDGRLVARSCVNTNELNENTDLELTFNPDDLAKQQPSSRDDFITVETEFVGSRDALSSRALFVSAAVLQTGHSVNLLESRAFIHETEEAELEQVEVPFALNFSPEMHDENTAIIVERTGENAPTQVTYINTVTGARAIARTIAVEHEEIDLNNEEHVERLINCTGATILTEMPMNLGLQSDSEVEADAIDGLMDVTEEAAQCNPEEIAQLASQITPNNPIEPSGRIRR